MHTHSCEFNNFLIHLWPVQLFFLFQLKEYWMPGLLLLQVLWLLHVVSTSDMLSMSRCESMITEKLLLLQKHGTISYGMLRFTNLGLWGPSSTGSVGSCREMLEPRASSTNLSGQLIFLESKLWGNIFQFVNIACTLCSSSMVHEPWKIMALYRFRNLLFSLMSLFFIVLHLIYLRFSLFRGCLWQWHMLFFRIYFAWKCIKIIYIFYFLKLIFDVIH